MAIATFDFPNLRIILPSGDVSIEVERDLYSAWKRASLLSSVNMSAPPAFRPSVGGDSLSPGIEAGAYFFFQNQAGWRIRPAEADATVTFIGNLAAEDPALPMTVPTIGAFTVLINGLQPITQSVEALLLEQQNVAYEGTVHIDTFSGTSGTAFPVGTASSPVDNITDAATIAAARGFTQINLIGSISLDQSYRFFKFLGESGVAAINVNGQDVSGCLFERVAVQGDFSAIDTALPIRIFESLINGVVTNFAGLIADTLIGANISLAAGSTILARCGTNIFNIGQPTIDFQGLAADFICGAYFGSLRLTNMTNAASDAICDLNGGRLTLDSTMTTGTVVVGGVGTLVNNAGVGVTVTKDGFVDGLDIKLIKALDAGNVTVTGSNPFVVEVLDPDDNVTPIARFDISADGRTRTRTL